MMRVISSPSISTMGFVTLIFAMELRSGWSAVVYRFGWAVIRRALG
jgi:NADH:ubiquinone oxidoreductase subunit 4 (subunit M)